MFELNSGVPRILLGGGEGGGQHGWICDLWAPRLRVWGGPFRGAWGYKIVKRGGRKVFVIFFNSFLKTFFELECYSYKMTKPYFF